MKRLLSLMLSISMAMTLVFSTTPTAYAADSVVILGGEGWLESFCVYWDDVPGASGYEVRYRKVGETNFSGPIDAPLIRKYPEFWRADVVGISAGTYEAQITPIGTGEASIVGGLEVKKHDRSGFGFATTANGGKLSPGDTPGAYKADGTPKDNAEIVYATDADPSGLAKMNQYDTTNPVIIRIVGHISKAKLKASGAMINYGDSLEFKGKTAGKLQNVTLEGIGKDSIIDGGINLQRTAGFEIRNLAFGDFSENGSGDGIGTESDCWNLWIHNNDFFYGQNKGGDKKKGDGSLDNKDSYYVTISYNHFWDSGKSSLLNGTKSDRGDWITYHHNFFDYSDSRHPRVRYANTHVYNNYYLGVGKYGIGAAHITQGVFAEGNYFENSKKPMLISMQGSDIAGGGGTFSSESGGIIKAYNNFMDNFSKSSYKPYDATSNPVEFDAYEVPTRETTVPNTITAKNGGGTYSNFDTNTSVLNPVWYYDGGTAAAAVQGPEDAKQTVINYSGRMQGGNVKITFTPSDVNVTDEPVASIWQTIVSAVGGSGNVPDIPKSTVVRPQIVMGDVIRNVPEAARVTFTPDTDGQYYWLLSSAVDTTPGFSSISTAPVEAGVAGQGVAVAGDPVSVTLSLDNEGPARFSAVMVSQGDEGPIEGFANHVIIPQYVNPNIPVISAVSETVARTSETEATIDIRTNNNGELRYIITDEGSAAPNQDQILEGAFQTVSGIAEDHTPATRTLTMSGFEGDSAKLAYVIQKNGDHIGNMIVFNIPRFFVMGKKTVINFNDPSTLVGTGDLPASGARMPEYFSGLYINHSASGNTVIAGEVTGTAGYPAVEDGLTLNKYLNTNGAGSASSRSIEFETHAGGELIVYGRPGNATATGRSIIVPRATPGSVGASGTGVTKAVFTLPEAGRYAIHDTAGGLHIFALSIQNMLPIEAPPAAPVLTKGEGNRVTGADADIKASITFSSDKAGTAYILPYKGDEEPTESDIINGSSSQTKAIAPGSNTLEVTVTADTIGIAVAVKDYIQTAEGDDLISNVIMWNIGEYTYPDTPVISAASAIRNNETAAVLGFTSTVAGKYYYKILNASATAITDAAEVVAGADNGSGDSFSGLTVSGATINTTDNAAKKLYLVVQNGETLRLSKVAEVDIAPYVDAEIPIISGASAARVSTTEATATFTSNIAGKYFYITRHVSNTAVPGVAEILATGIEGSTAATVIVNIDNLMDNTAAKMYLVVQNGGNPSKLSAVNTIDIPLYKPAITGEGIVREFNGNGTLIEPLPASVTDGTEYRVNTEGDGIYITARSTSISTTASGYNVDGVNYKSRLNFNETTYRSGVLLGALNIRNVKKGDIIDIVYAGGGVRTLTYQTGAMPTATPFSGSVSTTALGSNQFKSTMEITADAENLWLCVRGGGFYVYLLKVTTPVTGPSAPGKPSAIDASSPGSGKATVVWGAASDNGSSIEAYQVGSSVNGGQIVWTDINDAMAREHTFENMPAGTYTFSVRARNGIGLGEAATSDPVTVLEFGAPDEPKNVEAVPGERQIEVTWEEPESWGDSNPNSYILTISPDANEEGEVRIGANEERRYVFEELTRKTYSISIYAENENGRGSTTKVISGIQVEDSTAPRVIDVWDFGAKQQANSGNIVYNNKIAPDWWSSYSNFGGTAGQFSPAGQPAWGDLKLNHGDGDRVRFYEDGVAARLSVKSFKYLAVNSGTNPTPSRENPSGIDEDFAPEEQYIVAKVDKETDRETAGFFAANAAPSKTRASVEVANVKVGDTLTIYAARTGSQSDVATDAQINFEVGGKVEKQIGLPQVQFETTVASWVAETNGTYLIHFTSGANNNSNLRPVITRVTRESPDGVADELPEAPASVTGSTGVTNGTATVNWTAPTYLGTGTLVRYEVNISSEETPDPNGWVSVGTGTSHVFSGKAGGIYNIWVRAVTTVGTGEAAKADEPVTITSAEYRIIYNANGGTGSMTDSTAETPSVEIKDSGFTPSVANAIFAGWRTEQNGGTTYQPGDIYTEFPAGGGNVTLYAYWIVPEMGTFREFNANTTKLTTADFAGDVSKDVALAEGIILTTRSGAQAQGRFDVHSGDGYAGGDPTLEGPYYQRFNTENGSRGNGTTLAHTITIKDVKVGDKIEIVWDTGANNISKPLRMLVNPATFPSTGAVTGDNLGEPVHTLAANSTYEKYTLPAAAVSGTYYFGHENGTYYTLIRVTPANYGGPLPKAVTGITVAKQPSKMSYTEGSESDGSLKLSGLWAQLAYEGGETEYVSLAKFAARGIVMKFDNDESVDEGMPLTAAAHNNRRIVIISGDYSAQTDPLTVAQSTTTKTLSGIEVKGQPNKLVYNADETLDLTGLSAILSYSDTTYEEVALSDFAEKGIILSLEGGGTIEDGMRLTVEEHHNKKIVLTIGLFSDQTQVLTVTEVQPKSYTVIFLGEDGGELKRDTVIHGESATPPVPPSITGKIFKEWDKDISNVTSDLTVRAVYVPKTYTVTFWGRGEDKATITVNHGEDAKAPEPWYYGPSYEFENWVGDYTNVTSNLNIYAKYHDNDLQAILDAIAELAKKQEEVNNALNDLNDAILDRINDQFDEIAEQIKQIEEDIKQIKETLYTKTVNHSKFDENKISEIGGIIHANSETESVEFKFVEIDQDVEIDPIYNTKTKVLADISLEIDGVEFGDHLISPVAITVPLPEGIEKGFTILHYGSDGKTFEKVEYVEHENETFSFKVNSFSVFAFLNLKTLESINIVNPPNKTSYFAGEKFDADGMEVEAVYSDDTSSGVTDYTVSPSGNLSLGTTFVTISYTEGDVTKTVNQPITMKTPAITGITVKNQPTKLIYTVGEIVDLEGLLVTLDYDFGDAKYVEYSGFGTAKITAFVGSDGSIDDLLKKDDDGKTIRLITDNGKETETSPITVNYEKHAITVVVYSGEETGTAISSPTTAALGETVDLIATPNSDGDYEFIRWIASNDIVIDNRESANTNFVMPDRAVTIRAEFAKKTYPVNVTNGRITNSDNANFEKGENVIIQANTAPVGMMFDRWEITPSDVIFTQGRTTSFIMPGEEVNAIAIWKDIPTTDKLITVTTTGTGSGTANASVDSAKSGDVVTLTAIPEDGNSRFVGWTIIPVLTLSPSATDATATFEMPDTEVTVEAEFELIPVYLISLEGPNTSGNLDLGASHEAEYHPNDFESTVTVVNEGNVSTGELTIAITGDDYESFNTSTNVIDGIARGASKDFVVYPVAGLPNGTYEATVTVSGNNGQSASFNVIFAIEAPIYDIELKDGEATVGEVINLGTATSADYSSSGYERTITVRNVGNVLINRISINIDEESMPESFGQNKFAITNLASDGSNSFIIYAGEGLPNGTYTAVVKVEYSGKEETFGVIFEVAVPIYKIEIKDGEEIIANGVSVDFGSADSSEYVPDDFKKTITIVNTGNTETGVLNISFAGNGADSFVLSNNTIPSVSVSGNGSFIVTPKSGLTEGTYTATVTVSGENGINASFEINFVVEADAHPFSRGDV
ncbi:MAG: fibronectin type III domain-containing protein, partial [Eubacterium sp.]|nr:fibronectin type III domain-containing protein [Eubacterium sp.]